MLLPLFDAPHYDTMTTTPQMSNDLSRRQFQSYLIPVLPTKG